VGADAAIAAGLAHEGSLAKDSALHVFALAAATQASGRLTLTPEGRSFALTFRRGTVEHVASTDPEDDLGRFLVRKGSVRSEALARAEAGKGAAGGDLASALIAQRLVNPADVAALLQEHGAQLVQRALGAESGTWSWNPQAAPPAGAFPLGPPFAMLCAAVRALDATALVRRLGGREHRAATRVGGRIRMEDLRLNPQETRAAALFDGSRSAAEMAAATPATRSSCCASRCSRPEPRLGASRKEALAHAAPPRSALPPVASVRPGPPLLPRRAPPPALTPAATHARSSPVPPAPKAPALDRASMEALYTKLAGADHFTVLGVKQDAPGAQIKLAYFQLAKSYHPDAVPADAPPEVKKLCADVFAKVSEAWAALGTDASRAAYIEKLKSGGTAELDVMNIFQAENVFQAGTMLVKVRKYDEALRKFEEAMKLNSDEAEFGMWKSWCEFLLSEDKKRKVIAATSAIELELKRNPRCAQGYLFLGQMAKLAGDLALAERQLKRGLEIAPDHGDLRRELKYLRK
jgi:tetratricopeptide (TPR) repeat protein